MAIPFYRLRHDHPVSAAVSCGKKRITIITHSLGALSEASKYDNLNIISLGGIYSPTTDSFVGLSAIEALSTMRINKAFMGATGVSLTAA